MADKFSFPDEQDGGSTAEDKHKAASQEVEVGGNTNDEFEIEIVDDTPPKDQGRKPLDKPVEEPSDEELEAYSDKVKSRINELTHARHDERRAKEAIAREKAELEEMARKLLRENQELRGFVDTGSKQYADTMKSAAEAKLDMARRQLKDAQEAFDTDAIVAAQEALAEAKWHAEQAKNFRPTALQAQQDDVQTHQVAPRAATPDEKTLRWQAKNQWFGSPGYEEVTSFALGLHQKLVNNGIDPRSDAYFAQIDARLKNVFPDMFGEAERPKPQETPKKPASVVAPATRSSGAKRIQLTTTQLALAEKFGLTPQQYAAHVAKLEAQNG